MDQQQIADLLQQNHAAFIQQISNLDNAAFCKHHGDKWTAGQQLQHIILAVSPVNRAMGLPKFLLQWMFGKANRPSRTYEELVNKYHRKLQEGGSASARFTPALIPASEKTALLQQLQQRVSQLCRKTNRCSEKDLDRYILPHPLLGKLTLREMLYFTAYHVEHHRKQLLQ